MDAKENLEHWEEYLIPGTNVLKNHLQITNKEQLKQKEIEVTFQKLLELQLEPIAMNFDDIHLKEIHKYLFEDIYPFAGKYRTVYMEKNHSYFAAVNQIEPRVDQLLTQMNQEYHSINSTYSFACFLTEYYIELLHIHPFREGNGRTIREFIREFANAKSQELPFGPIEFNWSNVDQKEIDHMIDKSLVFKSNIELEFMKALEPKEKEENHYYH